MTYPRSNIFGILVDVPVEVVCVLIYNVFRKFQKNN